MSREEDPTSHVAPCLRPAVACDQQRILRDFSTKKAFYVQRDFCSIGTHKHAVDAVSPFNGNCRTLSELGSKGV